MEHHIEIDVLSMKENYEIAQYSRTAEEERMQREFSDYAVMPTISGKRRAVQRGSMVPSEFVDESFGKVAIINTETSLVPGEDHDHPMTVLLHRDEYTDIRSIEILCSCGKRAIITLEYDGDDLVTTNATDDHQSDEQSDSTTLT